MIRNPRYFFVTLSIIESFPEISFIIRSYLSSNLKTCCCQFSILGKESYSYAFSPFFSYSVIFNTDSSYIPYHDLSLFSQRKDCPLLMVELILIVYLLFNCKKILPGNCCYTSHFILFLVK